MLLTLLIRFSIHFEAILGVSESINYICRYIQPLLVSLRNVMHATASSVTVDC